MNKGEGKVRQKVRSRESERSSKLRAKADNKKPLPNAHKYMGKRLGGGTPIDGAKRNRDGFLTIV